jgi:aspartate-semialdehyde dehydrogenase
MYDNVPLIVPEVNSNDIDKNEGIIANPNCSTIQAVIPLNILNNLYGIKRIVYSTYQAVSGAGIRGIKDLENTSNGKKADKFLYPIYNNCLPHIDDFCDNGYTKEEMKMINETKKILNLPDLNITATCVRVPVVNCHSESINVEFKKEYDILQIKQELNKSKGIVVLDDISKNIYPIPTFVDGKDEIFVGRIRKDESVKYGINFWCVSDNVRKGAATNAVQILEKLLQNNI